MKQISLLMLAVLLTGCGGGGGEDEWTEDRQQTFPVTGMVTLDGSPLEGATVIFRSQDKNISASGVSDAKGAFSLTTYEDGDGAVEGEHAVMVQKYDEATLPENVNPDEVDEMPEPELLIPEKFASFETSGLTATINAEGENNVTLELTSE